MERLATLLLGNLVVLGFLVFLRNIMPIAGIKMYNWTKPLSTPIRFREG